MRFSTAEGLRAGPWDLRGFLALTLGDLAQPYFFHVLPQFTEALGLSAGLEFYRGAYIACPHWWISPQPWGLGKG
jgi:hypothetical protein